MYKEAVAKAAKRLRLAEETLDDLETHKEFEKFSNSWYIFLTSWKAVYTILEQGSKQNAKSRQWFGSKQTERKSDPLLQYLFQARNDEEHGLAESVRQSEGGDTHRLKRATDELWIRLNPSTGKTVLVDKERNKISEYIQTVPKGPVLIPVKDRGGKVYQPPVEHFGNRINILPLSVAKVGVQYLKGMLAEAEKLPNSAD